MIDALKNNIERFIYLLEQSKKEFQPDYPTPKNKIASKPLPSSILDFAKTKREHKSKLTETQLKNVTTGAMELSKIAHISGNKQIIDEINQLAMSLSIDDADGSIAAAREMSALCLRLTDPTPKTIQIKAPPIPDAIKEDVLADIRETEKCMASGCYRSATILCGRILETALHRKYFDVTGQDALEKNPGIGLGNLIAKLVEKNVTFDPGLTQQIHLINQVRVFSVHKKQEAFKPSRQQAEAIVLFTMDALEKLF